MTNTKTWRTDLKPPKIPPLMVHCFRCNKEFGIKWVGGKQQAYSKKNSWAYWTEETEGDKKICNSCLLNFYKNEKKLFWEKVKNPSRRNVLSGYAINGFLSRD